MATPRYKGQSFNVRVSRARQSLSDTVKVGLTYAAGLVLASYVGINGYHILKDGEDTLLDGIVDAHVEMGGTLKLLWDRVHDVEDYPFEEQPVVNYEFSEMRQGFYRVATTHGDLNIRDRADATRAPVGTIEQGSCVKVIGDGESRSQLYVTVDIPVANNPENWVAFVDRRNLRFLSTTRPSGCTINFGAPAQG